MIYQVNFSDDAKRHMVKHIQSGNKSIIQKIDSLVTELSEHPRTGTGKPERLKYQAGEFWSRKIDQKHRLVYQIIEEKLIVVTLAAFGHYGDK